MNINGRRIVITGASQGLGQALSLELSRLGARLALIARNPEALQRTVDRIRSAGGEAHAIAADVGDKLAVHPIAGQCMAALGGVDGVIRNASTLGPVPLRALLDTDCEDVERAFAVNVLGPFRLNKLFAAPMVLRQQGLILHISSDAAVEAYPTWGAYGLTKAALDHMSRTLAVELESSGVKVFSIDPGEMNTRMHADAIPDADPASLADPARVAERIARLIERADSVASGTRLQAQSAEALS